MTNKFLCYIVCFIACCALIFSFFAGFGSGKIQATLVDSSKRPKTTMQPSVQSMPDYKDKPMVMGNPVGNIGNGGYVNQRGEWIYYSNRSNDGKLYKIKADGTEKMKLDDCKSMYINVVGDFVYYIDNTNAINNIYKIGCDGKQKTKLNDDRSVYLNVVGDWIYYVKENTNPTGEQGIYKIKLDGSNRTQLSKNGGLNLNVIDGCMYWVYLIPGNTDSTVILKMKTEGTQASTTSLLDENYSWQNSLIVQDQYLFYSDTNRRYKLYRTELDGKSELELSQDECGNVIVAGDWIFYVNWTDHGKIYKMKIDGTQRMKIGEENCSNFNICNDKIYYITTTDIQYKLNKMNKDGTNIVKIN